MASTPRRSPVLALRPLLLVSLFLTTTVAMIDITPPERYVQPEFFKRGSTYIGCFSSSKPLTNQGTFNYQSTGHCSPICTGMNQPVMGLADANECWCGAELPPADTQVDDSFCNSGCTGYGSVECGGNGYWSIYLTGLAASVPHYGGSGGSSSSATTTDTSTTATTTAKPTHTVVKPSVVTSVAPGSTVVVTEAPTAPATGPTNTSKPGSSTNVAGIAAGVVVAIVVVAAIIAGVYIFLRRRKSQRAEEEYKRNHQVSDFMNGAGERKIPGTGYSQMSDSRLDPEAGRRNSVGSLADNQDYSRRILRVANPDSS